MMSTLSPSTSRRLIAIASVVILSACASPQPPLEQMAVSRAAVSAASSNGANEIAPVQLKTAIDKMTAAEKAMSEKKYDLARQLAEQAQVDAQLAGSIARSVKAQTAASAVREDSRVLRKEIDRLNK